MRYFFDIHKGAGTERDEVGLDLRDRIAARSEAMSALKDLVHEFLVSTPLQRFTIDVRDETGDPVFRVILSLEASWPA
jgi:hypothetical protein